jgi:hypothetical protein
MALLTATRPTGALPVATYTPAAVAASDTISANDLGVNGAYLIIINGGASSDTVTITDPGTTAAGSSATNPTNAVANGTTEVMRISPRFVNPSTNLVTVTHSYTTTVTYVLLPIG